MCKIAAIIGINDGNREAAWDLAHALAPEMSEHDAHGFGLMAATKTKQLFGARWLNNADALNKALEPNVTLEPIKNFIAGYSLKAGTNTFGVEDTANVTALALHARYATTGARTLPNTHPFVEDDTALIHNGVISNVKDLELKTSECDSEGVLNLYIEEGVTETPAKIQEVADTLRGYYACVVISKQADGTQIVDVLRDKTATLWVGGFDNGLVVFCTKWEIVARAAEFAGLTTKYYYPLNDETMLRFNATTGEFINGFEFEAMGYSPRGRVVNTTRSYWDEENDDDTKSHHNVTAIKASMDEKQMVKEVVDSLRKDNKNVV